jgi:Transglycosylase SLT domain
MSFHRLLHVAGWSAVILLTIVGFAAFNTNAETQLTAPLEVIEATLLPTTTESRPAAGTTSSSVELDTGWLDSVTFRGLVDTHFASSDVNQAVRLAWCLSRFDVDAIDPSTGAVGLFQIDPADWSRAVEEMGLPPESDPFNPAINVSVAAHIVYAGAGWGYWSCG